MKIRLLYLLSLSFCIGFISCDKDDDSIAIPDQPMLLVKFKFNKNQERLNNLGQPSTVPAGNAALSPDFNTISAHYFELAPNATTRLGDGAIIYHAAETNVGGETAIDFDQSKIVAEGE